MDTGQISLMPANVGMPTPGGLLPPSFTMLLTEPGGQAGGPFAGLLEGMAPSKAPQGAAATVSVGTGVPSSEKNGENASTTAVQDGVSGLMAGLLKALDATGKPLAMGTEQGAGVPATASSSDGKPQDVVLNADGLRMALLIQVNSGRMPRAGGAAEQQTDHGADNPLAPATEGSAEVPAPAETLVKKPRDVVMNAVGMQPPPLLIQVYGGRMAQADGAAEKQTDHGADKPLASAAENSAEVPAPAETLDKNPQYVAMNAVGMQPPPLPIQVHGGRMPQADGTVVQQAVAASAADTAVTSFSNNGGALGIAAASSAYADVGLNPPESLLTPGRTALAAANGSLKGPSADSTALEVLPKGNEPQHASQKEPDSTAPSTSTLPSRQVLTFAEQQNLAVESSTVSTERGTAPSDQNGSIGVADTPVSGSPGPGKGDAEVRATASSGVEVTAQQQQAVPLFRSASLEVALAESAPRNEARATGQAQDVSSAQNKPVAEIPAASTTKTAQAEPQQDVHSAKTGVMPVQVAPSPASSQEPDQAIPVNYHALERTMSDQAAVAPAAGKMGLEAGGEAVQTQTENAAAAKPVQSIAVEEVKFAGVGSAGGEFSMGDDKGTADNFMNGQFHASLMHQQGNADGAGVAGNVSTPVQNDVPQSGLPEQIMQQVRDRLVNHDLKAGNDQIVLRLSPENLGDLKLNLSMDGQRLKVEIVAENHMVRDALLQNADSLKESLARQNIRMDSFDVTTGGRGAGNPGQGQQQSDWRGLAQQKQQSALMSSGGYRLPDATTVPSKLAYQTPSQHAMVDLHF